MFNEVCRLLSLFVTIVVSPLIALMRDQVRAMMERIVHTVYIGDAGNNITAHQICTGLCSSVYTDRVNKIHSD